MRICVYEDRHVRGLEPLTLTRPAGQLLCGQTTLAEKLVRYFAATSIGHLCRPEFADLLRATDPQVPVNDPAWLRSAPTVLANARWVPPARPPAPKGPRLRSAGHNPFTDGPHLGTVDGEIAYAVLDTRRLQALSPATLDDCLGDWTQSLPAREVGGALVVRPWDFIGLNAEQLRCDFEFDHDPTAAGFHPTGLALVGPADRLFIHPTARIDPMVVADTTNGPVSIGPNAIVQAFTRLEGPCAIGSGSVLLGARVRAGTTIGPDCRVGGEVECSILLGHVNKYHDGFIGHSYLGEWVNIGAGTQTSDLRCDLQSITVMVGGTEVSTGRVKLGSAIGDHAQTGLGVLLDCGTVVGPFAQLLPTGQLAPREVAAFTRVGPGSVTPLSDVNRVLAATDAAMKRRGRYLSPALEAVYRAAAPGTSTARQATVLPLRRSA